MPVINSRRNVFGRNSLLTPKLGWGRGRGFWGDLWAKIAGPSKTFLTDTAAPKAGEVLQKAALAGAKAVGLEGFDDVIKGAINPDSVKGAVDAGLSAADKAISDAIKEAEKKEKDAKAEKKLLRKQLKKARSKKSKELDSDSDDDDSDLELYDVPDVGPDGKPIYPEDDWDTELTPETVPQVGTKAPTGVPQSQYDKLIEARKKRLGYGGKGTKKGKAAAAADASADRIRRILEGSPLVGFPHAPGKNATTGTKAGTGLRLLRQ